MRELEGRLSEAELTEWGAALELERRELRQTFEVMRGRRGEWYLREVVPELEEHVTPEASADALAAVLAGKAKAQ